MAVPELCSNPLKNSGRVSGCRWRLSTHRIAQGRLPQGPRLGSRVAGETAATGGGRTQVTEGALRPSSAEASRRPAGHQPLCPAAGGARRQGPRGARPGFPPEVCGLPAGPPMAQRTFHCHLKLSSCLLEVKFNSPRED